MHQLLTSAVQFNLNWVWLGLLLLAVIFLIVTVALLLTAMGSSVKRVKQLNEDTKPSLKQLNAAVASIQTHLDNTGANMEYMKSQVAAEVEAVTADIAQIQETVAVVGSTTGTTVGEVTTLVTATADMVSGSMNAVKRIRQMIPSRSLRNDKRASKVGQAVEKETRKGRLAMKKTKQNVMLALPRDIRNKVWLLLRPASASVHKGKNKIRKHKLMLDKQLGSGKHRVLSFRKKGKKLLRKGKRNYRRLRRKVA